MAVVCIDQPYDRPHVYPATRPMTAGIDSSTPCDPYEDKRLGYMDIDLISLLDLKMYI